jgi:hypothetical protein
MGPLIASILFNILNSFKFTFILMGSSLLLTFFYLVVKMPNKLNKVTKNNFGK